MNKSKLFYQFSEITTRQARGAYWINLIQTYFDPIKIMGYSAYVKILFPSIPTGLLITCSAVFLFVIEFVKYFIGRVDEKMGLWKKQSEYMSKKDHINPWNVETQNTLKEVCKALKITHKYKEL